MKWVVLVEDRFKLVEGATMLDALQARGVSEFLALADELHIAQVDDDYTKEGQ
jgi:hypothetical protein